MTRIPVSRRAPLGWRNIAPFTESRAATSFSRSRVLSAWEEMDSEVALGVSLGVIISMKVPGSIQSAVILQVGKGSFSGVAGVRSKTMPSGEYPVSRHADFRRN